MKTRLSGLPSSHLRSLRRRHGLSSDVQGGGSPSRPLRRYFPSAGQAGGLNSPVNVPSPPSPASPAVVVAPLARFSAARAASPLLTHSLARASVRPPAGRGRSSPLTKFGLGRGRGSGSSAQEGSVPGDEEEQKQLLQQAARQAGTERPHGHAWPMAIARGCLVLAPNPGRQLSPCVPLLGSPLGKAGNTTRLRRLQDPGQRPAPSLARLSPSLLPSPRRRLLRFLAPIGRRARLLPSPREAFLSEAGERRGSPNPRPSSPLPSPG